MSVVDVFVIKGYLAALAGKSPHPPFYIAADDLHNASWRVGYRLGTEPNNVPAARSPNKRERKRYVT